MHCPARGTELAQTSGNESALNLLHFGIKKVVWGGGRPSVTIATKVMQTLNISRQTEQEGRRIEMMVCAIK